MDSTPLLAAAGGLPGPNTMQDHPAFLRACHSPWPCIPQNILVAIRGFIVTYLTVVGIMIADFKLNEKSDFSNWRHIFDYAIISFVFVCIYHLITFSWTFTHLYYPNLDYSEGGIETLVLSAMSLPRNLGSLRNQFYFTVFYTLTVGFAFANSTIYWFITRQRNADNSDPSPPQESNSAQEQGVVWTWSSADNSVLAAPDAPFADVFGEGWFKSFVYLNLYGIGSLIMVIEVFWLNSIKRPYAIGSHLFGLVFFSGLYLGWAAIGKLLTDWYAFFWLDAEQVGSDEAVTAYCIGFILLAPIMYILMQGIVGIRDGLTRSRSEARAAAAAHAALES